jgi:hypothetical protein
LRKATSGGRSRLYLSACSRKTKVFCKFSQAGACGPLEISRACRRQEYLTGWGQRACRESRNQPSRCAAYVVALYLTIYGIFTFNMLLGVSFVIGIGGAFGLKNEVIDK